MNSMLAFKRDCINFASLLGDYQNMSIDDLADGYCKALDEDDEINKNSYLCALILRFWYTMKKMYDKTFTANYGSYEDYSNELSIIITEFCKEPANRVWQDKTNKTNAQACINKAIATRGVARIMYESNLDKNKANVLTSSLDAPMKNNPDYDSLGESIEDENESISKVSGKLHAETLIQSYIDRNKIVEAIILDTIAFNTSTKAIKKISKIKGTDDSTVKATTYEYSFWEYQTVQVLSKLPEDYANYFISKYNIGNEKLDAAVTAIKNSTNQKLYRQLRATLKYAKNLHMVRN